MRFDPNNRSKKRNLSTSLFGLENERFVGKSEWDDFKRWWVGNPLNLSQPYATAIDHPLLTQTLLIGNSVMSVIDIKTLTYTYTSPNWSTYLGWNGDEYKKYGVQFAFSRMPEGDQIGVTEFGKLINNYFQQLPENEKLSYRGFWDFSLRRDDGVVFKGIQQDCCLSYNKDGEIETLLLVYTKIDNVSSFACQHLRLTNGHENLFYKFDHQSKKIKQLETLSNRELEIASLTSKGYTMKRIADRLNISFHTVRTHHANILRKMDTTDSVQLVNLLRTWRFL